MTVRILQGYPFIVAEIGANHLQDLPRALELVDAAKEVGADALKLQTFQADSMVMRPPPGGVSQRMKEGPWSGEDLWALYERCALPWSWHEEIFARGRELGIPVFSTPFERAAVDFLERLGCPMYKIASFEILDLELIGHAAATGKPIVISTGMASLEEITEAVDQAARFLTPDKITLLKCTTAYPAPAAEANLATMDNMRRRFGCPVGLSDHTLGSGVAIAAALRGADMIEKHMTLNGPHDGGPDAGFSVAADELGWLIEEIHAAIDAEGEEIFGSTDSELPMLALRRTLHVIRDLKPGDTLTRDNVKALRPGDGLAPRELPHLLGTPVSVEVKAGAPLTWDLVRN